MKALSFNADVLTKGAIAFRREIAVVYEDVVILVKAVDLDGRARVNQLSHHTSPSALEVVVVDALPR